MGLYSSKASPLFTFSMFTFLMCLGTFCIKRVHLLTVRSLKINMVQMRMNEKSTWCFSHPCLGLQESKMGWIVWVRTMAYSPVNHRDTSHHKTSELVYTEQDRYLFSLSALKLPWNASRQFQISLHLRKSERFRV